MEKNNYTDQEIVSAILANDCRMIEYFFCKKCSKMLSYIAVSMFDSNINRNELISELFIYLSANNWRKLAQFDFRSSLMTWMSVVAIRFFQKKRIELIESQSSEALINQNAMTNSPIESLDQKIDIMDAINKMKNARYRYAIIALDIEDRQPDEVAKEMAISVDNLYNLHRRALVQLRNILNNDSQ